MVRVARTGDNRVESVSVLVEHIELLLPHDRAMVYVISDRCIVEIPLRHLFGAELLRHVDVRIGAPRQVVRVLVDPLLVMAGGRHPVVEQDIVLATTFARFLGRVAAR